MKLEKNSEFELFRNTSNVNRSNLLREHMMSRIPGVLCQDVFEFIF